jgi:DNA-binding NarL/FixJ family response regulator
MRAQVVAALARTDPVAEPTRAAASGEAVTGLTPRELDVLKLVAQGLSNADIARQLVVSDHTVHRHLANIRRKLNLSSRRGGGLGRAHRAGVSLAARAICPAG